jgi:hypothetical protein
MLKFVRFKRITRLAAILAFPPDTDYLPPLVFLTRYNRRMQNQLRLAARPLAQGNTYRGFRLQLADFSGAFSVQSTLGF